MISSCSSLKSATQESMLWTGDQTQLLIIKGFNMYGCNWEKTNDTARIQLWNQHFMSKFFFYLGEAWIYSYTFIISVTRNNPYLHGGQREKYLYSIRSLGIFKEQSMYLPNIFWDAFFKSLFVLTLHYLHILHCGDENNAL